MTNTRPDICFIVNTLSQYMVEPRHVQLVVAKQMMRYLKGTLDCGLRYATDDEIRLHGYTDSDWDGSTKHEEYLRMLFQFGIKCDIMD